MNPATKGIVGYLPAGIASALANAPTLAAGGMAVVLGIWTKDDKNAALRILGSVGRNFGVTTD
jgi:hypothetical protein